MTLRRGFYFVTSSLVAAGLVLGPLPAQAQGYDQAPEATAYDQAPSQDPPALVGRLASVNGAASYHAAGQTTWTDAVPNTPLTDGDAYWTQPQAGARLEVESNEFWMNGQTELDVNSLDEQALNASLPTGEIYVDLRVAAPGQIYAIQTPRGTVTLFGPGRFDILAGDTDNPTVVSALDGRAEITAAGLVQPVSAGESVFLSGANSPYQVQTGPLQSDDFIDQMRGQDQIAAPQGAPPPPVVAEMTGGEDLNQYGTWQPDPSYGDVWYPNVGADWAPYRDGRWSYVAPWGWTWVDAEPWGFAPFHYGRWVQVGPRWGWVPVYPGYRPEGPPVYAPALVTFFGIGAAVGAAVALGFGLGRGPAFAPGADIGWVPLGPREAYLPPYAVSRTYINRVNITNIRTVNVTNIINERQRMPINRFTNAHAAVVVPASAMAASRPVRAALRQPAPAELARVHGLINRAPIAPGAHTLGITPHVAQHLHLPSVAAPRAAGPEIRPAPARLRPGTARTNLPPLQPGHGARPGMPHPPARVPGGERPQVRAPGAEHLQGFVPPPRSPAAPSRPNAPAAPNRPDLRPRPQPGQRPVPHPEARPAARPEARPSPHPEARPPADRFTMHPAPRPQPRPEARPAPRPQLRPAPRPDMHPAPRPAFHPPERPQARPEPRPQMRPEPRRPEPRRPEPPRPEDQHKPG